MPRGTHRKSSGCKESTVSDVYQIWAQIKYRCSGKTTNKHDARIYGDHGIRMCPIWMESFEKFLNDVGPRPSRGHSLDRIDNEKGYEPGNVRWATRSQQQNNRRDNLILTLNGETKTAAEWAKTGDVSWILIWSRYRRGWSDYKILTTPPQRKRKYARSIA